MAYLRTYLNIITTICLVRSVENRNLEIDHTSNNCIYNYTNPQYTINCVNISSEFNELATISCAPFCNYALREFSLTGTSVSNLRSGVFSSYRYQVETLNVTGNRLKELKNNVLNGLTKLTVIDASNNDIASIDNVDITYLKVFNLSNNVLTKSVFNKLLKLKQLETLNLSNNTVDSLDEGSLSTGKLTTLILDNNKLSSVDLNNFKGTPLLETLSLTRNNIFLINFEAFKSLNKLETLNLSHNKIIISIDKTTTGLLNSVKYLDLSYNDISKINEGGLPSSLEYLDLSRNKISTELNKSIFRENKNLTFLNMSYNVVSNIDSNAFDYLENLKVLDLSGNLISQIDFVNELKYVNELYLAQNDIDKFDVAGAMVVFFIKKLDIHENKVKSINTTIFKQLTSLNVNSNQLTETFINCHDKLENIEVSNNKVDNIIVNGKCTSLRRLTINGNNIKNISAFYENEMKGLVYFDGSNNEVLNIDRNLFYFSTDLEVIILNHNMITNLLPGTFANLSKLITLDISYNKLMSLSFGLFTTCNNIRFLNLSHNNLKYFDVRLIFNLNKIRRLILDSNQLSDINMDDLNKYVDIRDKNKEIQETEHEIVVSIGGNRFDCKWLANAFHKSETMRTFQIDALNKSYHTNNIDGIPCEFLEDSYDVSGKDNRLEFNQSNMEELYKRLDTLFNSVVENVKSVNTKVKNITLGLAPLNEINSNLPQGKMAISSGDFAVLVCILCVLVCIFVYFVFSRYRETKYSYLQYPSNKHRGDGNFAGSLELNSNN